MKRSRAADTRIKFVQQAVDEGEIELKKISGADQRADNERIDDGCVKKKNHFNYEYMMGLETQISVNEKNEKIIFSLGT